MGSTGKHTRLAQMEAAIERLIEAAKLGNFEIIGEPSNSVTIKFPDMYEAADFARWYETDFQIKIVEEYFLYMDHPRELVFHYDK